MLRSLPIICLLLGFCPLPHASAHYLWVTIDDQGGGTARIIFEEAPSAGDGHYLDHFAGTSKTWFRSLEQIEPSLIQTSDIRRENRRWLEVKLPAGTPPAAAGRYTFRTSVEEATPGREGDEDYALIRHNCTLIMQLPLEK